MPLGSFRLNALSKKLITGGGGWAAWDGSLDGNDGGFDTPNTHILFQPVDDTWGIISYRDGNLGAALIRPLLRTGNTLSFGGSGWTNLGANTDIGNDGETGRIMLSTDKTYAWWIVQGSIVRINNISSAGNFTVSNRIGNVISDIKHIQKKTDDTFAVFGGANTFSNTNSQNPGKRYDITLSGTTTISMTTNETTTVTNLPGQGTGFWPSSIVPISQTQAILVIVNTGHQSAWLLTRGSSTATQIGSTYTDTLLGWGSGRGRYALHDLTHDYAVGFGKSSGDIHRYYVATSSSFTRFSINQPAGLSTDENYMLAGTGYCSLDNDRFMVKHNPWAPTYGEFFWIVNRTTQSIQSYFKQGNGWEEATRSSLIKWNSTSLFSGNWRTGRVIRIS